jgi:hypothetical protein
MEKQAAFKTCPSCSRNWETRDKFLSDTSLRIVGYQADFDSIADGLFYFTHHIDGCNTTLAVLAGDFFDMYTGEIYSERMTGSEECPGYCLRKDQLDRCEAFCEYAFVREIIEIIRQGQER